MGTWNTKINGNDTFQDIYQNFFDRYNEGENPVAISKEIQEEFAEMFEDYDDRFDSLFGLALAQWETKSLDTKIYKQVKDIIESGVELERWKGEIADNNSIKQRQKVLEKFLNQISTEREKPKRRGRQKFEFKQVDIVRIIAPDGKKIFEASEHYTNGVYGQTGSSILWGMGDGSGGGSVFYFTGQGQFVTARWLDNQTLEVTHDKNIIFTKKDDTFYYCGDGGKVIYIPQ